MSGDLTREERAHLMLVARHEERVAKLAAPGTETYRVGHMLGALLDDADALAAEVERLREENARLTLDVLQQAQGRAAKIAENARLRDALLTGVRITDDGSTANAIGRLDAWRTQALDALGLDGTLLDDVVEVSAEDHGAIFGHPRHPRRRTP